MQCLRLDLVGKHAFGQECDIIHRIDVLSLELQFLPLFRDFSLDSKRCALAVGLGFDDDGRLVREVKLRPHILQGDFLARNGSVRFAASHADLSVKIALSRFFLHEIGDVPASVLALPHKKLRLYDRHVGDRGDRRCGKGREEAHLHLGARGAKNLLSRLVLHRDAVKDNRMPRLDAHGADGDGNAERFGRLCRKRPARLLDVSARAGDISRCAAKERKKEERDGGCSESDAPFFHRLFLLVVSFQIHPRERIVCGAMRLTYPPPQPPLPPHPSLRS